MFGIQLVRLLDVLNVNEISEAVGVSPRSVIVRGEDFRSVERVLVNGFESPEFTAYSQTELVAEIPALLRDSVITDVAVFSQNLTFTERSLVELTFGTRPRKVSGTLRLLQSFLRLLLRSSGSNLFHPQSGGGLLSRVGQNINSRSAADVQIAVSKTKQYLVNIQTQDRSIPPSERLLAAEITGLTVDPSNTSIYVTIVLTSHDGRRAGASLVA